MGSGRPAVHEGGEEERKIKGGNIIRLVTGDG